MDALLDALARWLYDTYSWWVDYYTQMWAWASEALAVLLQALNPVTWVFLMASWVLENLPLANTEVSPLLALLLSAFNAFYLVWTAADFFINMQVFGACFGIMLFTESILFFSRAWKFVKTHII